MRKHINTLFQLCKKVLSMRGYNTSRMKELRLCCSLSIIWVWCVGDILNLTMDSFMRDGNRYRLDMHEQKTGKYRNFTVPVKVYNFIRDYAYDNSISPKARLFPITERAVLKHLKVTCEYLKN